MPYGDVLYSPNAAGTQYHLDGVQSPDDLRRWGCAMIQMNAPDELRRWYEVRQKTWQKDGMTTQLRLPNAPNLNKATAAFETRTHVASVTVWGTGMVEFIVLDLATNQEAIVSDTECESVESLWRLLDDHIRDFLALVGVVER